MTGALGGRVALVTGGGRGIGRAIAERFGAEGASVAVTARTTSQLQETVAAIGAAGGRALALEADITDRDAVEQCVAKAEAALGPIDVLINNAGTQERGARLWEADPEEWFRTIEVNVFGQFLVTRAVVPGMIARGGGRVVFISSGASTIPGGYTGFSAYGASKAAVNRIAETLATEAGPHGISVFAIHPGVVRTELLKLNLEPQMDEIAPGRGASMWDRDEPPEHAAEMCVQLASGMADSLSGCYFSAAGRLQDDLEALLPHAGKIRERGLYTMRVAKL